MTRLTQYRELSRKPVNDAPTPARNTASDDLVSRALAAIRAEPERRWTVANLGKLVGCSRATFARRFRAATGKAPLQAVREARLARAARLLAESPLKLAAIAAEVGYVSEFALSRALLREYGVRPSVLRSASRAAPPTERTRCAA